jgi:hypothetical protein
VVASYEAHTITVQALLHVYAEKLLHHQAMVLYLIGLNPIPQLSLSSARVRGEPGVVKTLRPAVLKFFSRYSQPIIGSYKAI